MSTPSSAPPPNTAPVTSSEDIRQAEVSDAQIMDEAARQLCHPDVDRPFSGISDAVQRLLPYHMLAAPTADEADEEEAAVSGRMRVAGRRDAWEELQLRRVAELAAQLRSVEGKVAALEDEVRNPSAGGAAEDGCLLEQLQLRTLHQQMQPGTVTL